VLTQALPGRVRVSRISEKVEMDDEALHLLAGAHLIPGSEASVVRSGPDGVVLETEAGERTVPAALANLMFVSRG
jgi:hypothetical protein